MSSYAEWLAEEEEAALRWAQTTAQPTIAQSTTTPKGEEDDPWSDTPEDAVRRRQMEMATGPIDPMAGW